MYRVGWHEKDEQQEEEEELRMEKEREREREEEEGKKSVGTKEDQRRTDRARINCRNTGSSLSTSATHGFSSVGKYVECILHRFSNASPIPGMRLAFSSDLDGCILSLKRGGRCFFFVF